MYPAHTGTVRVRVSTATIMNITVKLCMITNTPVLNDLACIAFLFDSMIKTEETLFFINLNVDNVANVSSLLDMCQEQVPDIPSASVFVMNETNPSNGRDFFYCQVETSRGNFRSSSVTFQGECMAVYVAIRIYSICYYA